VVRRYLMTGKIQKVVEAYEAQQMYRTTNDWIFRGGERGGAREEEEKGGERRREEEGDGLVALL